MLATLSRPALTSAYDAAAGTWQDTVARLGYPGAYAHLLAQVPVPQNARVLDVGCGPGTFSRVLLDRQPTAQIDLLDPSAAMLGEAQRRLGRCARPILGGVGTDRTVGGYDVVLCAHVTEHLPDPEGALFWMAGQLTPGGVLLAAISRPHWCTALLRWKWGHRAFAPQDALAMLRKAGFADARHIPFRAGPPSRTSAGYIARSSA
ncbi:MAG: class I SAM-dependent methyltransferase [Pseudomonadota bacterium]